MWQVVLLGDAAHSMSLTVVCTLLNSPAWLDTSELLRLWLRAGGVAGGAAGGCSAQHEPRPGAGLQLRPGRCPGLCRCVPCEVHASAGTSDVLTAVTTPLDSWAHHRLITQEDAPASGTEHGHLQGSR